MIDLALTLADYLIKFFQKRDDITDEYFERYITPAYEAAETVFSDYVSILTILREKIIEKKEPVELVSFLEQERNRYLSRRMRLRAEITNRFENLNSSDELPEFEKGIMGLMISGVGTFGKTEHPVTSPYSYPSDYRNKNRIPHTLLDLLSDFSFYASSGVDYDRYLDIIDKKLNYLHSSWQDVVNGYSKYKMVIAPTPSNKTFRKRTPQNTIANGKLVESVSLKINNNGTNAKNMPTKPEAKMMGYKREGD